MKSILKFNLLLVLFHSQSYASERKMTLDLECEKSCQVKFNNIMNEKNGQVSESEQKLIWYNYQNCLKKCFDDRWTKKQDKDSDKPSK